jgi:hypothetical protein
MPMPPPPPRSTNIQEKIDEIIAELKSRGVQSDYCSRCNAFDWSVEFLEIPARPATLTPYGAEAYGVGPYGSSDSGAVMQTNFSHFSQAVPTGFLPVACIVCKNCGYTMFHNLGMLGKRR